MLRQPLQVGMRSAPVFLQHDGSLVHSFVPPLLAVHASLLLQSVSMVHALDSSD